MKPTIRINYYNKNAEIIGTYLTHYPFTPEEVKIMENDMNAEAGPRYAPDEPEGGWDSFSLVSSEEPEPKIG